MQYLPQRFADWVTQTCRRTDEPLYIGGTVHRIIAAACAALFASALFISSLPDPVRTIGASELSTQSPEQGRSLNWD